MHTPDTPERDPQKQHGLSSTGYGVPTSGYETSDVKVGGIAVFLVSLFVFLIIFFVFCFGMGKVINNALVQARRSAEQVEQLPILTRGKRQESRIECSTGAAATSCDDGPFPNAAASDG